MTPSVQSRVSIVFSTSATVDAVVIPAFSAKSSTKKSPQFELPSFLPAGAAQELNRLIIEKAYTAKSQSSLECLTVIEKSRPLLLRLEGMGEGDPSLEDLRRLGASSFRLAEERGLETVAVALPAAPLEAAVEAIALGALLRSYSYTKYKSKSPKKQPQRTIQLLSDKKQHNSLARAKALAEAVSYARDLVNCPPSDLLPLDLAAEAKRLATASKGRIKAKVYREKELAALGAGGILGVSRGSASEACMIHLSFKPKKKSAKSIACIGKGVTFDSGGLSIKTRQGMEDMKCDMAGAASVLGLFSLLLDSTFAANCQYEVHGLIPASENMLNEHSMKPGDVLQHVNNKTVEITNTDAEGRLLLADALSFSTRLKPDAIIDLATLTGACMAALGGQFAGMFSNNQPLAERLQIHGEESGDLVWPLPLEPSYRSLLDSPVADMKNSAGSGPGAITAALFLKEFIPEGVAWVHLDIAGPAYLDSSSSYRLKGGAGYGVALLARVLEDPALLTPERH